MFIHIYEKFISGKAIGFLRYNKKKSFIPSFTIFSTEKPVSQVKTVVVFYYIRIHTQTHKHIHSILFTFTVEYNFKQVKILYGVQTRMIFDKRRISLSEKKWVGQWEKNNFKFKNKTMEFNGFKL